MPVCSIVIPTYNSEKTLQRALDSVLEQTFPDFELLIIDGLSTDRTSSIIGDYAARDKRIRFVSEKDKGIYDAMNKGIDLAKGDWVYFLGSDDQLYKNDVLASVFTKEENLSSDVLYGDVYSSLFNGIYDGEFDEEKILNRNICHQAIFFRKEVFNKIGKYNLKYKGYADWDHNFRWFFSGRLSHRYVSTVIADFSAGGFSHASEDLAFKRDKVLNYLLSGKRQLLLKRKLGLIKSLCGYALMKRDMGLISRIFLHLPSIVLR
jgi:glycosyltransferase involved in cell wall biosynthesis